MKLKITAACAALMLSACAPDPFDITFFEDAKPALMRAFAKEYKGKTLCTDYDAKSHSCLSLMKFNMQGKRFTILETAAVEDGKTITIRSTARLEGNRSCTDAKNIKLVQPSAPGGTMFLSIARAVAEDVGGICSQVLLHKGGYIYRLQGRNGEIIPPGDIPVRVAPQGAKLRQQ